MFDLITRRRASLKNDVLAGLTAVLTLIPEAVAFTFVAGIDPMMGLYGSFFIGFITAVFGGRPGMISGATGAMAVVMVSLVADHGVEYLFAAVVLTGLMQITAGISRLGKFIRMVPYPVMLGFVNGLAIVILLAQIQHFQFSDAAGAQQWMSGAPMMIFAGLILLTMAIIHFLPKLTTAFPSSLAAILVVSFIVIGLDVDTKTVGDLA